jgi:hygromycin-B 7''-O-kinase
VSALELSQVLASAGLSTTGHYEAKGGWVSRAWVGSEYVVRLGGPQARGAYEHEASVVELLSGSDVPHAPHIAHSSWPAGAGAWSVSGRLAGRTLHDAWPTASVRQRRSMIESIGAALRSLHRVPVSRDLRPPWLRDALAGGPWPAYHPPVVDAALSLAEDARTAGRDARLLDDVASWVSERLPLFASDELVLVHGDLHGSNVMVDDGSVTGLIDFAEAVTQPADVELDTILRWCARPQEFPPMPGAPTLDAASLAPVPEWLQGAYPELFARTELRSRLQFYDMWVELAILGHHPDAAVRDLAQERVVGLLGGRSHLASIGI